MHHNFLKGHLTVTIYTFNTKENTLRKELQVNDPTYTFYGEKWYRQADMSNSIETAIAMLLPSLALLLLVLLLLRRFSNYCYCYCYC